MKLVMTLLVRDEIDIIRENLDFHLQQGVDHIVAIDNGSRDGTRDVLADYSRTHPLTVIDEPEQDYNQTKWMSDAAIFARETLGATWVLNNDADEFWLSPTGNLKDQIAETTADCLVCRRHNMLFASSAAVENSHWAQNAIFHIHDPYDVPLSDMPLMAPLPCPYFYRRLPPKVLCKTEGLQKITQGNHSAIFEHKAQNLPSDIEIYHYPVRSESQLRSKVENGGASYAANKTFPPNVGWHWRRWYQMLSENGLQTVLEDALPSEAQLTQDVAQGRVTIDKTMIPLLKH